MVSTRRGAVSCASPTTSTAVQQTPAADTSRRKISSKRAACDAEADVEVADSAESLRTPKIPKLVYRRSAIRRIEDDPSLRTPIAKLRLKKSKKPVQDELAFSPDVKPLKGREEEFTRMCTAIQTNMAKETPVTFYLSGLPGTGKTATVRLVLKAFEHCCLTAFLNCASSRGIADLKKKVIGEAFADEDLTFDDQVKRLDRPLILIDHISSFSTLYAVFQWPQKLSPRIVIIGIANSIDLTERFLPKLKLTISPILLQFAPYERDQIKDIIVDKLAGDENTPVDGKAIELCARKVAAVSGDLRSALHVINQTRKTCATPTPKDIQSALSSVYSSPLARAKMPMQPRILLAVCLRMSHNKKVRSESFSAVLKTVLTHNALFATYRRACDALKIPALSEDDLETAWSSLESQSFVSVEQRTGRIRLQVDVVTARAAISDSLMISQIDALNL